MTEPCELGIRALAKRIHVGDLTPSELLESCLGRIDQRDPLVQAWEVLDVDGSRAQAKELDGRAPRGPLHGLPVGVKDIIDVAGLPTRCGSPLRANTPARADAEIVHRLREAGAVILGKTVTTEFAYFTPGKTRNPHDVRRTPGGSSSGSAAAVADFMVPFALGTQTAASTTRPAAYCGVAGLVMPPRQVDDRGITGLSPTLDSLGFIGRSVDDLQLIAAALLGLSSRPDSDDTPSLLVCSAEQFGALESGMLDALDDSSQLLRRRGARTAPLSAEAVPASLIDSHRTIMAVEAARSLAAEAHGSGLSQSLQSLLDQGLCTSEGDYHAAREHVRRTRQAVLGHLGGYDAILAPAAAGIAPEGAATGSPAFSRPWQAMGLPSVTIPGRRDRDGMPLGLQVIGSAEDVPNLLAVAKWVEDSLVGASRVDGRLPDLTTPHVVGEHR